MPKWLKGMFAPTLMLWLYALALGITIALSPNGALPGRADYIGRVGIALILASWVAADARKRRRELCYDYYSFVFFAWPVVVPVYLFRTRGVRAFLTLLCFAGIWLVAILAAMVVSLVWEFLF